MKNLKLAIFDLTDCEGCELQFLTLREKLLKRGHDFEITNWRLANKNNSAGPFDVTFVEGAVIAESDIEILKQARKQSKIIIALGSCAEFGGVQAALLEKDREKYLTEIYGGKYKPKSHQPKPISYYVEVDAHLPGCPVNEEELERILSCLFFDKKFTPKKYSVCYDCKAAGNPCLFLDEGFCLGPVTRGGCKAPCPSNGLRCFGCFGPIEDAKLSALEDAAKKNTNEVDIKNGLNLFFSTQDVYKDYELKKKQKKGKKNES